MKIEKSCSSQGKISVYDDEMNLLFEVAYKLEDKQDNKLSDLFISGFKSLNFQKEEKQKLSRNDRHKINLFKALDHNKINTYAHRLAKKINNLPHEKFIIETKGCGGFICLTALFQALFPTNYKFEFNLYSVPLNLLPQNIIDRGLGLPQFKINHFVENDSWLSKFESLYSSTPLIPARKVKHIKVA